jgi:hypothetical protein
MRDEGVRHEPGRHAVCLVLLNLVLPSSPLQPNKIANKAQKEPRHETEGRRHCPTTCLPSMVRIQQYPAGLKESRKRRSGIFSSSPSPVVEPAKQKALQQTTKLESADTQVLV